MTVQAEQIIAAHERLAASRALEEQWSDSFYFGGGDGRGLAFYSRIGRRPNEGVVEGALGHLAARSRDSCSRSRASGRVEPSIACGAALFECLEPLHSWELLFEGPRPPVRACRARRDRARQLSRGPRDRKPSASPPGATRSPSAPGSPRPVASAHYEQPGSLSGAIEVDGRRRPLDRQRHARPLVGRARLAAGPLLALVRLRVRSRQLPDAQQRRPRGRRRDGRRLSHAGRRARADRLG